METFKDFINESNSEEIETENGSVLRYVSGNDYVDILSLRSRKSGDGAILYSMLVERMRKSRRQRFIYGEQHDLDGRPYLLRLRIPDSETKVYMGEYDLGKNDLDDIPVFHHRYYGRVGRIDEEVDPSEYTDVLLETTLLRFRN